ncbi:MAG TPA: N-acetylmuramoyl-L-alanine amidase [Chthoniobacterales bacterium]
MIFRYWLPLGFVLFSMLTAGFAAGGPQGFGTVVVDAGHGGYDPGGMLGVPTRPTEKAATLDVAQRLARILRGHGLRVVMTRTSDVYVTLGQRMAFTEGLRGQAIFVSIHFNAALRAGARGIETYYFRPDSLGLAVRIHGAVTAATSDENRFVHRRGFFVIRRSAIPAVLCEGGFLTNPDDRRLIDQRDYRQKLAAAIAAGILAQQSAGNPAGVQAPRLESSPGTTRRQHRHTSHRVHRKH